jgi:hypothetical protein
MKTTKFCHLKNLHGKGVITVASELIYNGDYVVVNAGVSYSSPKDIFKKSLGRQIAQIRMKDCYTSIDIKLEVDEINHKGIMNAILNTVYEMKSYPDWAHDVLLDYIEWYNGTTSLLNDTDADLVFEWLKIMPNVDTKILKSIVSDVMEEL